jgi:hypothetical protein
MPICPFAASLKGFAKLIGAYRGGLEFGRSLPASVAEAPVAPAAPML